jgi:hypothetical protein
MHRANLGYQHAGYKFIPAFVETHGYLGKPIVGYLQTLSAIAVGRTLGVSRDFSLDSAFRELSVAPMCRQGFVCCASANLLARASGRPVLEGSDVPFLDQCGWLAVLGCTLCAWVVLRCLCFVCMRVCGVLRLRLFLASIDPAYFLPS